jgi:hypothetical protein
LPHMNDIIWKCKIMRADQMFAQIVYT